MCCLTSKDGGLVWKSFDFSISSVAQLPTSISSIKGVVGSNKICEVVDHHTKKLIIAFIEYIKKLKNNIKIK
jgi:hypothetical protein